MSGRCKSCNEILTESEMVQRFPGSDDFADLCSYCLAASNEDYEYDQLDFDDEEEDDY